MAAPPPVPLAVTPTPLRPLDRLGAELGFAPGMLWIKRDDLTGLGGGGNKARKLEYLVADALEHGCDTLVTGGGVQSNHVRTTGAAARVAGLRCVAVLGGPRPARAEGNLVLDHLFGIELSYTGDYDAEAVEAAMAEAAVRVAATGGRPYEIPLGGASPVGTLGYVAAADELVRQAPRGAVVYTASGTGGTQAGLVVGLGHHDRVRGVDVGAVPGLAGRIDALVAATASLAGRPLPRGTLQLTGDGPDVAYGEPTDASRSALALMAELEGIVLDPVYSAKALAGLVADRRRGDLPSDRPVVFLHTGGTPALFTERYGA